MSGALELTDITYEVSGAVAIITLNRPNNLNAISARPGGTRDQILAALGKATEDTQIGCVLIRGAGKSFCGGGDLTGNAPRETLLDEYEFIRNASQFHKALKNSQLPIVAAVHGHCLGAGLLLATSCDFVIAGESAQFGFPEGRLGLVGVSGVVNLIGRQWSKFMMLTGESLNAHQAVDIGLALTVEPDDTLQERALDLAQRISRMPREATFLNRRTINAIADAAEGDDGTIADAHDTITLGMAAHAKAPDGRGFREIIKSEGMDGVKKARAAQWETPWL